MTNVAKNPPRFVGVADGPKIFVPELGCDTPTFTIEPGGKLEALRWHVPLQMRGDYRPEELANYDPQKTYRTDDIGKVLCYGYKKDGTNCSRRAVNRFSRCDIHGGRLHPLDKLIKDKEPETSKTQERQSLSRYRQYLAGQITVDDLDDEELAACGFRAGNGSIYKPKSVPRELAQAFTRAIYERAKSELLSHTVEAAKTMAEIMSDHAVDPDVRLKAANALLERNLGKTPQVVAITGQAPWEEIFDGITSGPRESSRRRREIPSERIIEAETINTVDDGTGRTPDAAWSGRLDEQDSPTTDDKGDKGFAEPSGENQDERNAGDSGATKETIEEFDDSNITDARLFARNPAVLARTLEVPETQPEPENIVTTELSEPDQPLIRQRHKLPDGQWRIRHVLHIYDQEYAIGPEFTITEGGD